jgi:hypothetical protein
MTETQHLAERLQFMELDLQLGRPITPQDLVELCREALGVGAGFDHEIKTLNDQLDAALTASEEWEDRFNELAEAVETAVNQIEVEQEDEPADVAANLRSTMEKLIKEAE